MELGELHVLQRQTSAQHHAVAVAGAGVGGGRREVGATVAAGGQYGLVSAEHMQRAIGQIPGHHAPAGAGVVHDQVQREVFDEEFGVVLERLLVKRVQDGMAGAVGGGAGALGDALAVIGGHAAERPLINLAFLGAREGHAVVLQFEDRRDRLAAHVFDGVLIAQPVGTLDGVVEMPLPHVGAHVAERRRHAALSRHGVAAGGKYLGQAGRLQSFLRHAKSGAQPSAAGADHDHVVIVMNEWVCVGHETSASGGGRQASATLSTATMEMAPSRNSRNCVISSTVYLTHSGWT